MGGALRRGKRGKDWACGEKKTGLEVSFKQ